MTVPSLSPLQVGSWLERGASAGVPPHVVRELEFCRLVEEEARKEKPARRRLSIDVDPHDLEKTGWGIVFARGAYTRLRHRLEPLLELREKQAGKRFKPFTYTEGQSAALFCASHRETLGATVRPERIPYYLLLVGGPEEIPFEFQYHLSLNRAVGRIGFADVEDYGRYARHVVEAEKAGSSEAKPPHKTVFFSVRDENDEATSLLSRFLVEPLSYRLTNFLEGSVPAWDVEVWRDEEATKAELQRLLRDEAPGLLLVSCHGRRIDPEYDDQELSQGSLLCYGPRDKTAQRAFAACDVSDRVDLRGQIAFLFACYGAGTPTLDGFPHERKDRDPEAVQESTADVLAERPFLARLPQALLARGTLGVLGHVDRGWTLSFAWTEKGMETEEEISAVTSLEDSVKRLLWGDRLGHALRPLHERYPILAAQLAETLHRKSFGVKPNTERLGVLWTAVNDARNFIILGDPAVYLLGRRSFLSGMVRLDPRLLRYAHEKARGENQDVEVWINELIRGRTRGEGDRLP